jgi:hypothetical protein
MIRDRPLLRESVDFPALMVSVRAALPVPTGVELMAMGLDELPRVSGDATHLRQLLFQPRRQRGAGGVAARPRRGQRARRRR